uniref:Uncharacterized protein n=1 Tax=Panagrolaimus sp. JU765 TaxID=591449 RepID=A0AC34RRB4_9BILA
FQNHSQIMPSSIFEERHFYNRSYITVNTTPNDYSPFPYSNYSAIPKYNSRLDDYASRFSTSKISPTPLSDDGYGSSSASSTFTSFRPRHEKNIDDLERSTSRNSNHNHNNANDIPRNEWKNIQIISRYDKNDDKPPIEILKSSESVKNLKDKFGEKNKILPSVKFITENEHDQKSKKKNVAMAMDSGNNDDQQQFKNVKMTIQEIEER